MEHPHKFRQFYGYALASKGHDLRLIQDYPGHHVPGCVGDYTRTAGRRFEGVWR